MTHSTQSLERGFTLVETLVAITLLAIALIGPFVAVQNAVQASYVARDQLIASQLAQEGVEYVRSVRDNNYLASPQRTWMDGLSSYQCYGEDPDQYCHVDPTQGDIHGDSPNHSAMQSYSSISSLPYLYLASSGLYNQQDVGSPTRFKRLIQLRVVNASEVEVLVEVQWISGTRAYSVTVTDNLRDWI